MFHKRDGIFFGVLLACALWCVLSDTSPKNTLDLNQYTLIPALSPTDSYRDTSNTLHYFDIPNTQASAHASAIVNVSGVSARDFMLLYFAGSREGARDIGIYQSFFTFKANDENLGVWSEPTRLLDAQTLSKLSGKFIKKLGNPIAFVDAKGRTHLFVVGVSMGGWATSKLYWLRFDSDLRHLSFVKELYLSPFLNLSHLVRTPPMLKDDGGFILPIYHELARKYPLLLDFSPDLRLDSVYKPLELHSQLQPSFIAIEPHTSIGIYRNHKAYNNTLFVSQCRQICEAPQASNMRNFDSSSVLFGALDSVYMLHNQTQRERGNKREELWIMRLDRASLDSGREVRFEPILKLDTLLDSEVSYPSVAVGDDFAAIAYTYGRKHIRVAFVPKGRLDTSRQATQEAKE